MIISISRSVNLSIVFPIYRLVHKMGNNVDHSFPKPKVTPSSVLSTTPKIFDFLSHGTEQTWKYSQSRGWNQRIWRADSKRRNSFHRRQRIDWSTDSCSSIFATLQTSSLFKLSPQIFKAFVGLHTMRHCTCFDHEVNVQQCNTLAWGNGRVGPSFHPHILLCSVLQHLVHLKWKEHSRARALFFLYGDI